MWCVGYFCVGITLVMLISCFLSPVSSRLVANMNIVLLEYEHSELID